MATRLPELPPQLDYELEGDLLTWTPSTPTWPGLICPNLEVARRELQSCLAWSASTLDHLTKTVKSRVLRLGGCIILRTLGRIIGESLRLRLQTGLAMWFAQANNMTLRQREETPIPRLISLPDPKSERQESLQSQTAIRKIINQTFNNPATSAERAIQAAYQHKLQAVKVNNNHYAHQLGQMITQLQEHFRVHIDRYVYT